MLCQKPRPCEIQISSLAQRRLSADGERRLSSRQDECAAVGRTWVAQKYDGCSTSAASTHLGVGRHKLLDAAAHQAGTTGDHHHLLGGSSSSIGLRHFVFCDDELGIPVAKFITPLLHLLLSVAFSHTSNKHQLRRFSTKADRGHAREHTHHN